LDDDIFDRASLETSMKEAMSNKKLHPVTFYVHKKVRVPHSGETKWMVLFDELREVYYLKHEYITHQAKTYVKHYYTKYHNGKPLPDWVDSFFTISIRAEEHGKESVFYRTKGNKTRSRIGFVITLKTSNESSFESVLKFSIKTICHLFQKRDKNHCGALALDYIRWSSPKGTSYKAQGLYGHLLQKTNGDEEALENRMTEELINYFKAGPTFSYDNNFDKYLVDFDIKTFMETWVGANNWDDVSEETKKALYRDYPKRGLPQWSAIFRENF